MSVTDTIAAVATPPGRGAIGIIRVSGAEVPRLARALLGRLPMPRHATRARFLDDDGSSLDEGIAIYFAEPGSFTGEAMLELQGHGGPAVLDLVMRRLLQLGCRMARPGEFSERAFLNGKMDLARAEAVADLIDAGSAAAARAAVRSLQGEFSERVRHLQGELTGLRRYVEAAIDFPDEEIDFLSDDALAGRLQAVFAAFESLEAATEQGAILREGVTVVIAGRPNAGKSSLLNRLVGDEVAIVTEVPGTTRDILRHAIHIDGLPVCIIDTAGLRETSDRIEAEGVRRARQEISRADLLLYVVDASLGDKAQIGQGAGPEAAVAPPGIRVIEVFNKIDLPSAALDGAIAPAPAPAVAAPALTPATRVRVSARTGEGLQLLRDHIKAAAGLHPPSSSAFSARRRHVDALHRARERTMRATDVLRVQRAFELFAEDLRLAQQALAEVLGEFTSEDLLSEIFGSFCIGK